MVRTQGILLAAGSGTRLWPLTSYVNKHLCAVYDKPLIYYPLTNLILAGCESISIIVNQSDFDAYSRLTAHLQDLNVTVDLVVQPENLKGIPSAISCGLKDGDVDNYLVLLGDNILVSRGFISKNIRNNLNPSNMRIFTHPVDRPERFGVVERNSRGDIKHVIEKPTSSISREAVIGAYVIPADIFEIMDSLVNSARGETEIVDVIDYYLKKNRLDVEPLTQGTVWLDAGTTDDLEASSSFVSMMQRTSGELLGSIEEAALKRGLVTEDQLISLLNNMGESEYKKRLVSLVENRL